MSERSNRPPYQTPPESNGCLTALLIGAGILMLLPGLCVVLIVAFDPVHAFNDPTTVSAFIGFFGITAGGIALIWWAVRRPR
ncbi:MAG TPA: hypothetical protein VKX28_13675 [Xanthobacteraceae bacterium]|nr:hypothetical protein [Xanthobacteraceae bacterium]